MPPAKGSGGNAPSKHARLPPCLGVLRIEVRNSIVVLQPHRQEQTKGTVPSLQLDLRTGKVITAWLPCLPESSQRVLGVLGLMRLEAGAVLALITKATKVTNLEEGPVYKVADVQLVTHEAVKTNEKDVRHAALLQEALDVKTYGSHMYFSVACNITASAQHKADAAAAAAARGRAQPPPQPHLWSRSDPRFLWNAALMKPIIDAGGEAFATPVMVGYVGQVTNAAFRSGDGSPVARAVVTVLSRHAAARAAAGPWRRGVDVEGHAASLVESELLLNIRPVSKAAINHVESIMGGSKSAADSNGGSGASAPDLAEAGKGPVDLAAAAAASGTGAAADGAAPAKEQEGGGSDDGAEQAPPPLVEPEDIGGAAARPAANGTDADSDRAPLTTVSFVLVRGSAPLSWAQPPDLRPQPKVLLAPQPEHHRQAFSKHVAALQQRYGKELLLLHLVQRSVPQDVKMYDLLMQQQQASAGATATAAPAAGSGGEGTAADSDGGSGGCRQAGLVLDGSVGHSASWLAGPRGHMVLLQTVAEFAGADNFFLQVGSQVLQRQSRFVRTSTMSSSFLAGSCADVADVAQAALALEVLTRALCDARVGPGPLVTPELPLHHGCPELLDSVRLLWGHASDVLADQVDGIRGLAGRVLTDSYGPLGHAAAVVDNASRWYHSTFSDARKQDALDIVTGACKVEPGNMADLTRRPKNMTQLQLGIMLMLLPLLQLPFMSTIGLQLQPLDLLTRLLLPCLAGLAMLAHVVHQGTKYLEQPLASSERDKPWLLARKL